MKFSLLGLGTAAEHDISIPLVGGDGNPVTIACKVRPLTGAEEANAIEFATDYAKKRGVDEAHAREGTALWDLGYMVKVLHLACLDGESMPRQPFFDGGPEQILAVLPRETIALLFELQQHWQDEVSPSQKRMPAHEMLAKVREWAEADDERPFVRLSPGLRWICARSMARLLVTLLEGSSPSSSSTESTGQTSSSEPSKSDAGSESSTTTDSPTPDEVTP
jgi:hypothetical protein